MLKLQKVALPVADPKPQVLQGLRRQNANLEWKRRESGESGTTQVLQYVPRVLRFSL